MSLRKGFNLAGRCCSLTIVAATLMITANVGLGQTTTGPTSDAEIAWFWTGRAGFNPTNGNVLPYGYLTIINGVNSPMFSGAPSEATAFFTFRYSMFQALPLPSNLDQNLFLTTPATFDLYYDPNPNRNWNDPTTFSTGTKIATFSRPGFQGEQLYVTQYQAYSAKLVSSQPFTIGGQTLDFANLTPGVTVGDYLGVIPGEGFSLDFPLVFSISSYAVATHIVPAGTVTSAIAGPSNATARTREFRLDGSRSTSAAGTGLKYQWSVAPGSPSATILRADTANPVVRFGSDRGNYVFQLKVTDADGNSSADFTTVNFPGN
jgi:PKD domain